MEAAAKKSEGGSAPVEDMGIKNYVHQKGELSWQRQNSRVDS